MDMNVALGIAGAVTCLALSAVGSAFGTGFAAAGAIGAWKKCYAQNRPAPFQLMTYVGAPITQTLYGMLPGGGAAMLILGAFAGLAIGMSALFQGRAAACAADSHGETGQGLTNNLSALGIVETVAIFVMIFTLLAVGSLVPEVA